MVKNTVNQQLPTISPINKPKSRMAGICLTHKATVSILEQVKAALFAKMGNFWCDCAGILTASGREPE